MPVDRTLAEDLATNLVDMYANAETRLMAEIARRLADGIEAPDWAQQKLAQISMVRRFAERLVARLAEDMTGEVEAIITEAYSRGGVAALNELGRTAGATRAQLDAIQDALPGTHAIQRMVNTLVTKVQGTHLRILRETVDVYRRTVATTALPPVLQGTTTRLRAAQVTWERFLSQGIRGFTDRAGRNWELASYVEMATRTGVAQAAVEGHLDRLEAVGLDLVIVSNAPQECKRCRPWEGKVLARSGPDGRRKVRVEHATQDRMITVEIEGTVDEAVRDGLMHPNCRHSLSAYLAGVTKPITNTEDPEGDENRQQLRALERKLRQAKRDAAASLTPEAKKAAAARVREIQAEIREHVDATGLIRQRHREQIGQAR